MLVDEDTSRNTDFVPDLPLESTVPTERLKAFRQPSTGQLAVRYMLIAIIDDAFTAPVRRPALKDKFVMYFGEALADEGHDAAAVFDSVFDACRVEGLIFGTEDAGYFGGFRPSRRP